MHVNVSIIGLNRLSTSLALALKRYQAQPKAQHTFTITGSDERDPSMKAAQKLGALDRSERKPLKAADNADLIVMNAPPGQLEELYARLGPGLKHGAVVLDMTILKEPAVAWAERHFPTNDKGQPLAYLVGIAPLVNGSVLYDSDTSAEAATADLFDGSDFLVTPDPKCPGEAIALAEDTIRLIGGKPRFMDPAEHDGLAAATEELPALLGAALFYALHQSDGWPEMRRMVNPTLALMFQNLRYQSQEDLQALFTLNQENLVRHLGGLIGVLEELHDTLAQNDADKLEAFLSLVGKEWEKWDVKRQIGQWETAPQFEAASGPLGSMGIFGMRRRARGQNQDTDDRE
jgi:prephenate dehydrogenase